MSRPKKWRNVCCLPKNSRYGPLGCTCEEEIRMTVDEYEAIRLIDHEGLNQEACAQQMNVARTTVQGIYTEARKKLAELLVSGKMLVIEGGEYKLCDDLGPNCGRGCAKHRRGQGYGASQGMMVERRGCRERRS